jgi:hypothetical protein
VINFSLGETLPETTAIRYISTEDAYLPNTYRRHQNATSVAEHAAICNRVQADRQLQTCEGMLQPLS